MKIVIDTKDIESFYNTLSSEFDEWYAPTNYIMLYSVLEFLKHIGKDKVVKELEKLIHEN